MASLLKLETFCHTGNTIGARGGVGVERVVSEN